MARKHGTDAWPLLGKRGHTDPEINWMFLYVRCASRCEVARDVGGVKLPGRGSGTVARHQT